MLFFVGQSAAKCRGGRLSYRDRLDQAGAFKPSCRRGILSIRRGVIVDSGGDLGTVLVGRQGAAIKRPAGFAFTGL